MNVIDRTHCEAMMDALNRVLFNEWKREEEGNWFRIEQDYARTEGGIRKVVLGINWSACGTKTVEETKKFINRLQEATEVVERINSEELYLDIRLDQEITEEEYDALPNAMADAIKNGFYMLFFDLLLGHSKPVIK